MRDKDRKTGVLLHPTSLPGKWGIGDLGEAAFRFGSFSRIDRYGSRYGPVFRHFYGIYMPAWSDVGLEYYLYHIIGHFFLCHLKTDRRAVLGCHFHSCDDEERTD